MKRILIADDDREIVSFMSDCLKEEGFEPHAAYDGEEALAALRRIRPDLLVLDLIMPGVHGFDVCQQVREDPELRRTPILIVTGKRYTADERASMRLGADAYLRKPYSADELVAAVRKLVDGKGGA